MLCDVIIFFFMTHFSPPIVGLSRRPSFARATLLHPGATSVSKLRSRVDGYATFVYKGLQRKFKNVFVGFLHDAQRAGENARGTRQRVVQMTRLTTVLHDVPRARMRYRVRRSRSQLVSRM